MKTRITIFLENIVIKSLIIIIKLLNELYLFILLFLIYLLKLIIFLFFILN